MAINTSFCAFVSVISREEASLIKGIVSFVCGVAMGWYLSEAFANYFNLPRPPLVAIFGIMGRDLVKHFIHFGKENPIQTLATWFLPKAK